MSYYRIPTLTLTALAVLPMGSLLGANLVVYTASFVPQNESNVTGNAILTWDQGSNLLTVHVMATNVEPNVEHMMHIHGLFNSSGNPADSQNPTPAQDKDGDGFVEDKNFEAASVFGDIILPLPPITTTSGLVNVTNTIDLNNQSQFVSPDTGKHYSSADLFPLNMRGIEMHGMTVATGMGMGTTGEVNGTGGYLADLPIATAEIMGEPIPEPVAIGLTAIAMFGVMFARHRLQK